MEVRLCDVEGGHSSGIYLFIYKETRKIAQFTGVVRMKGWMKVLMKVSFGGLTILKKMENSRIGKIVYKGVCIC